MKLGITCDIDASIEDVAKLMLKENTNHIMVSENGILAGIITSFDITKAVASHKPKLEDVFTKDVITVHPEDAIEVAVQKLEEHNISTLPVINKKNHILGMVSSEDLSRLLGRRKTK